MVTDQLEPAVQAPVDSKIESSAKPIFEVLKDNENTPQETTEDSPDNVADSDEKDIVALAVESGHADSVTNGATTDVEVVAVFDSSSIAAGPVPPIQVSGYDPRYRRNFEIEVLYYDPKDFLITNKPWDLRVDGDTSTSPTAESLLYAHFTEHSKLYLLHQLDYVTSGIHCWGLSKQAASNVGKSFMRKEIKKTYTALVRGHVQEDSFIIDKDLVDDPQDEKRSVIAQNGTGKPSQTEVQVLARGYFLESPVSHVALTPVTGRRHQLRVHLAAIGHPIIGDPAYEHPKSEDAFRTMLHSWKLEMPVTKVKTLKFEAAEPFGSLIRDTPGDYPEIPRRMPLVDLAPLPEHVLARPKYTQMQDVVDEHLKLSYEYQAKWEATTRAGSDESRSLAETPEKDEQVVPDSTQSEPQSSIATETPSEAQVVTEPISSEAAASADTVTEGSPDKEDSAVLSQAVVDDHLQLSYEYQRKWTEILAEEAVPESGIETTTQSVDEVAVHHDDLTNGDDADDYVRPAKRSSEQVFEDTLIPSKRGLSERSATNVPIKKVHMSDVPEEVELTGTSDESDQAITEIVESAASQVKDEVPYEAIEGAPFSREVDVATADIAMPAEPAFGSRPSENDSLELNDVSESVTANSETVKTQSEEINVPQAVAQAINELAVESIEGPNELEQLSDQPAKWDLRARRPVKCFEVPSTPANTPVGNSPITNLAEKAEPVTEDAEPAARQLELATEDISATDAPSVDRPLETSEEIAEDKVEPSTDRSLSLESDVPEIASGEATKLTEDVPAVNIEKEAFLVNPVIDEITPIQSAQPESIADAVTSDSERKILDTETEALPLSSRDGSDDKQKDSVPVLDEKEALVAEKEDERSGEDVPATNATLVPEVTEVTESDNLLAPVDATSTTAAPSAISDIEQQQASATNTADDTVTATEPETSAAIQNDVAHIADDVAPTVTATEPETSAAIENDGVSIADDTATVTAAEPETSAAIYNDASVDVAESLPVASKSDNHPAETAHIADAPAPVSDEAPVETIRSVHNDTEENADIPKDTPVSQVDEKLVDIASEAREIEPSVEAGSAADQTDAAPVEKLAIAENEVPQVAQIDEIKEEQEPVEQTKSVSADIVDVVPDEQATEVNKDVDPTTAVVEVEATPEDEAKENEVAAKSIPSENVDDEKETTSELVLDGEVSRAAEPAVIEELQEAQAPVDIVEAVPAHDADAAAVADHDAIVDEKDEPATPLVEAELATPVATSPVDEVKIDEVPTEVAQAAPEHPAHPAETQEQVADVTHLVETELAPPSTTSPIDEVKNDEVPIIDEVTNEEVPTIAEVKNDEGPTMDDVKNEEVPTEVAQASSDLHETPAKAEEQNVAVDSEIIPQDVQERSAEVPVESERNDQPEQEADVASEVAPAVQAHSADVNDEVIPEKVDEQTTDVASQVAPVVEAPSRDINDEITSENADQQNTDVDNNEITETRETPVELTNTTSEEVSSSADRTTSVAADVEEPVDLKFPDVTVNAEADMTPAMTTSETNDAAPVEATNLPLSESDHSEHVVTETKPDEESTVPATAPETVDAPASLETPVEHAVPSTVEEHVSELPSHENAPAQGNITEKETSVLSALEETTTDPVVTEPSVDIPARDELPPVEKSAEEPISEEHSLVAPVAERSIEIALGEPLAQEPTERQHLVQETVVEEPSVAESIPELTTKEPVVEESTSVEPLKEESVVKELTPEFTAAEPILEESALAEPLKEESTLKLTAEESVVQGSASDEPMKEESVAKELAPGPVVEESTPAEPLKEESVVAKESIPEPTIEEPIAEKTTPAEPVKEEPVVAKESIPEPTIEEPVADKSTTAEPLKEESVAKELVLELTAEELLIPVAASAESPKEEPVATESTPGLTPEEPVVEESVSADFPKEEFVAREITIQESATAAKSDDKPAELQQEQNVLPPITTAPVTVSPDANTEETAASQTQVSNSPISPKLPGAYKESTASSTVTVEEAVVRAMQDSVPAASTEQSETTPPSPTHQGRSCLIL